MPSKSNTSQDLLKMSTKPTLVRPPSPDHTKAEIEHILELTQLNDIDPVCLPSVRQRNCRALLTLCGTSTQTPALYGILPEPVVSMVAQSLHNASPQLRTLFPRISPYTQCTATLCSLVTPKYQSSTTSNTSAMVDLSSQEQYKLDKEAMSYSPLPCNSSGQEQVVNSYLSTRLRCPTSPDQKRKQNLEI